MWRHGKEVWDQTRVDIFIQLRRLKWTSGGGTDKWLMSSGDETFGD